MVHHAALGRVQHGLILGLLAVLWLTRETGIFPLRVAMSPLLELLYGGLDTEGDPRALYSTDGGARCTEYLTLGQHFTEHVVSLFIAGAFYNRCVRWAADGVSAALRTAASDGANGRGDYALGQRPLAVVLWVTIACELYCKVVTHKVIYMLQPCHVVTFGFACVASLPRRSPRGTRTLLYLIGYLFAPMVALLVPDTTTLHLRGEVTLFFVEHWLAAVIAPLYLLNVSHAHLSRQWSAAMQLLGFAHFYSFHYFLLIPLAYVSGANVQYMLCPPLGFPLNAPHGPVPKQFFRPWGFTFMLLMSTIVATAFVQLSAVLRWLGKAKSA
jgi:hypothetical protein|tara:strand:+ start:95 stop:1075 length:981 start_codon:yes stop_codon:yes gene_type:complete